MVTLCIAILLASGLAASKICQRLRLPSVTGYIFAGLLLGPTGFSLVTQETISGNLQHFTQIALMLIAFGIGEHIEIKKLRTYAHSLIWISFFEAAGAFLLVSTVIFLAFRLTGFELDGWTTKEYIVTSLLLGSVGIATAPATTLLVIRELKAKGPLTSTLMAIVAIDDGLAIVVFGLVVSAAHQVLGQAGNPLWLSICGSVVEIVGSLLLGVLTAAVFLLILDRLKGVGEFMTGGLAALLLCGEIALLLHLSPLLAGMAAGFSLVNKAEKDVRIFRALNRFEPPIYVLFFTLAGTHLDVASLQAAGIFGIIYFLSSVGGKIAGIQLGGWIGKAPTQVRKYLGFAMVPQAGVAIGLIFLLSSDETLSSCMQIITPIVLAGVFFSELIGPISSRFAITSAGEAIVEVPEKAPFSLIFHDEDETEGLFCPLDETFRIIPWDWQNLSVPHAHHGYVLFHALDPNTARGLARMSTIIASYYRALPMAVRMLPQESNIPEYLFHGEHTEVHSMGYILATELVPGPDIAAGMVAAVECNDARAVVLAYPLKGTVASFRELLNKVAAHVRCPVAVVRFRGELHTERILIPLTDIEELKGMFQIIAAFDAIGEHRLHILYMLSSTADDQECKEITRQTYEWLQQKGHKLSARVEAVPTEARLDLIEQAAQNADLVIMHGTEAGGMKKFMFGSLVDSVSVKLRKTLIVVYNTETSN